MAGPEGGREVRVGRLVLAGIHLTAPTEGRSAVAVGSIRNEGPSHDVVFLSFPGGQVAALVIDGGESLELGPGSREATVATLGPPAGAAALTVQSFTYGTQVVEAALAVRGSVS